MPVITNDIGSATESELEAAARSAFGRMPDVSNPTLEIMVEKVIDVVRKRLSKASTASEEKDDKPFAVFLMTDEFRSIRQRLNADRIPTDIVTEKLSGHLWIASPNFAAAGRRQLTSDTIGNALNEVEEASLGNSAAIVVDFSTSKIYIYQAGVEKEDDKIVLSIADEQPDAMDVGEALQTFVQNFVVTPNCQTSSIKTWSDGGNYFPAESAEKKFQELLCFYLRARFGDKFRIEDEVSIRSGRVDVVVHRRVASGVWETQAAIELKVARSFSFRGNATSPSALVRHMRRGYGQIKIYKEELDAVEGWLVLYDMRLPSARGTDLMAPHAASAATDGISLRTDSIYGTADDYRDACMAAG